MRERSEDFVEVSDGGHLLYRGQIVQIRKQLVLDDGALRFVRPNGEAVESVTTQPAGDSGALRAGKFATCWRGDRMNMDLAVDLLIQKSQKARDVPAGT